MDNEVAASRPLADTTLTGTDMTTLAQNRPARATPADRCFTTPAGTAKPQHSQGKTGTSPTAAAGEKNGPGRSLGYTRNLLHPPTPQDRTPHREARAQRFELLATARTVLSAAGRRAGLQYGHDLHRTAKCRYIRRSAAGLVGVHMDRAHAAAFYSNLTTCGSVWSCPICAAKVQERRREEIAAAIDWAWTQELKPVMLTITFPHRAWHSLRRLIDQQADALTKLRSGKAWQSFKSRIGYQGLIRSLELTHGRHGWHPHTHEIWFVDEYADADAIRREVARRWLSACARAGLIDLNDTAAVNDFLAHSIDIKDRCSASDYLAKQDETKHWGADREMAKASTKAGRAKGFHPFGLLAEAAENTDADARRRAGRLFVVYSMVMKGKRQLFWSHGLKDRIGLRDISDEELAEESREEADDLGALTTPEWHFIRTHGLRAQVLDAAENGGWAAVVALLKTAGAPPPEKGELAPCWA